MNILNIKSSISDNLRTTLERAASVTNSSKVLNTAGYNSFSKDMNSDDQRKLQEIITADWMRARPSSPKFYTQGDNMALRWYKFLPKKGLRNNSPSNVKQFTRFDPPTVLATNVKLHCSGFECTQANYQMLTRMGMQVHAPIDEKGKPSRFRYLAGGLTFHTVLGKVSRNSRPQIKADGTRGPFMGPEEVEIFAVSNLHLDLFIRGYSSRRANDVDPDRDIFPSEWKAARQKAVDEACLRVAKAKHPPRSAKPKPQKAVKSEAAMIEAYGHLKVVELRNLCKKHKMKHDGKKLDLIRRLDKAGKL